jgi:hypothetical protein
VTLNAGVLTNVTTINGNIGLSNVGHYYIGGDGAPGVNNQASLRIYRSDARGTCNYTIEAIHGGTSAPDLTLVGKNILLFATIGSVSICGGNFTAGSSSIGGVTLNAGALTNVTTIAAGSGSSSIGGVTLNAGALTNVTTIAAGSGSSSIGGVTLNAGALTNVTTIAAGSGSSSIGGVTLSGGNINGVTLSGVSINGITTICGNATSIFVAPIRSTYVLPSVYQTGGKLRWNSVTNEITSSSNFLFLPGPSNSDLDIDKALASGFTMMSITLVGGGGGGGYGYSGNGTTSGGNGGNSGQVVTSNVSLFAGDAFLYNIGAGGSANAPGVTS